jgi:FtsH-binding integral membrane protein
MFVAAALLGTAAILIAVGRLGPLDLHDVVRYSPAGFDLDDIVQEVAGWIGMALAVSGILSLIYIWGADRFRISIGRLMVIVAMLAVLLLVVVTLRQRERARRTSGTPLTPSTPRR